MRMMSVPSLVLFDLDETLCDHRHSSRTALAEIRSRHEPLARVSLEEIESRAYEILSHIHAKVLANELSATEARLERIRALFESCGEFPSVDLLDRAAREYGIAYRKVQRAVPGSIPLLKALRKNRKIANIAVLTNHLRKIQVAKLESCGLTELIDFMVTSEDVGHLKPAAEIFQAALNQAGVGPTDAVMVGDSWEGDVVGAKEAGLRAVWFNPRAEEPRSGSLDVGRVAELRSFEPMGDACRVILSA
jgi:HAD superfamily hydrolase (TIGR01549 family)